MQPNEILTHKFDKSKVFGYKTNDVDSFIQKVFNDYETLYKEKEALDKKVNFLADKLSEYRQQENKLTDILLEAKKVSNNVIAKANEKAQSIISDAQIKASELTSNAQNEVEMQKSILSKLKTEVNDFKNRILSLYNSHIDLISKLPSYQQPKEIQNLNSENLNNNPNEPNIDNKNLSGVKPPIILKARTFSISLDKNGVPIKIDEDNISNTQNIPLVQDVKKISQQFKSVDETNDDSSTVTPSSRFREPLKFGSNYKLSNKNKKK